MCDYLFITYAKYSEKLMEIFSNSTCSIKFLKIIPFLKSLPNRVSENWNIFRRGSSIRCKSKISKKLTYLTP